MSEQTNGKKQEGKGRTGLKERWSYVILALIMFFMFVIFGAVMINYINNNNKAWCEIIDISTPAKPIPKPAVPSANPTAEQRYEGYQALIRLGNRFGCN